MKRHVKYFVEKAEFEPRTLGTVPKWSAMTAALHAPITCLTQCYVRGNQLADMQLCIVKSKLRLWNQCWLIQLTRNRRIKQSDVTVREQTELQDRPIISSDLNESIVPQSVQDCQFDLSSSDICPANISAQTGSNKIQSRTLKTQILHFKDSFFAWKFVIRKTQIKRYREKALCFQVLKQWQKQLHRSYYCKRMIYKQKMFWFRNMQERIGLIDKRKIRRIWNSYTDKYLFKRFFRFWNNYCEVIHGLTRSKTQNLFLRRLTRKAHKLHLRLWTIFTTQKNHRNRASQLGVNMHNTQVMYQVISLRSLLLETKLSDQVLKFMHSNNMSHRTNMFRTWWEFPPGNCPSATQHNKKGPTRFVHGGNFRREIVHQQHSITKKVQHVSYMAGISAGKLSISNTA